MSPLNENLRVEALGEFFRANKLTISSAVNDPHPFFRGLRNKQIITEEEFEKCQNEITANPDNIKKPIYDMLKNINSVSALMEICSRNLEVYPDLKTISQDMKNVLPHVENRTVTTRANNEVPQREENNLEPSAGGEMQTKKKHGLDFTGPTLAVHCGRASGVLFIEKIKKGVSKKCIKVPDGRWFTLPEFEKEGGRGSWKCWKRSICSNRVPLGKLIAKKKLPNTPHHRRIKRKTPSRPIHQSSQFQASASNLRTDIQNGLERMAKKFEYFKTMQEKLQDIKDHLGGLQTEKEHLEQALNMSEVQKQMIDIIHH